jgi:DNA integrity scanning protein DisA with diadenylate cyclase activity
LIAIFNKYSPLHDGAVIIYNGRIKAARCVLPVSESDALSPNLGLRHRAAVGMTEITDTLVVVVSEETGQISTSNNGNLIHNLSIKELRANINAYLTEKEDVVEESIIEKLTKEQTAAEGAEVQKEQPERTAEKALKKAAG